MADAETGSGAALRTIVISAGLAMAAAAVEVFAQILPGLAATVSALLPPWLQIVTPYVGPALAAFSAFLLRWSAKYHKKEVKAALYEEPPDMIQRAYKQ